MRPWDEVFEIREGDAIVNFNAESPDSSIHSMSHDGRPAVGDPEEEKQAAPAREP